MTVQEFMKLPDDEIKRIGAFKLGRLYEAYKHFESTKAFAERCKKLADDMKLQQV